MVDNEKYIKEAEVIEGGFLDLGFEKYLVRLEIVGQEDGPTIIRSTIEYKVDAEHASNASLVSTGALATIADAITKYIKEQKNPKQAAEQTSEEQAPRLSQPKEKKRQKKKNRARAHLSAPSLSPLCFPLGAPRHALPVAGVESRSTCWQSSRAVPPLHSSPRLSLSAPDRPSLPFKP